LKIIVDENIVFGKEAFSEFGDVELVNGRQITNSVAKDCDILITRSITKVNEKLLSGTKVKFVGTTTIGVDHLDENYLSSNGIFYTNAPGCNSFSVTEYIFAALLYLSKTENFILSDKSIGIVGVGNIGSKVAKLASSLGMNVLLNDPPRKRKEIDFQNSELEEILKCDIITIHTPLILSGIDSTFHLFDKEKLESISKNSILINTSRGEVVDNLALQKILKKNKITAVFDVWENEPNINFDLANLCKIATPHIAGYSFDGKLEGTRMVFEKLNSFLNLDKKFNFIDELKKEIVISSTLEKNSFSVLQEIFSNVYSIEKDDSNFRRFFSKNEIKTGFDFLRKNYPKRREIPFYNFSFSNDSLLSAEILKNFRINQKKCL